MPGSWEKNAAVAIVNDAADAILLLDVTGRIKFWNRGASEIFGYATEEIIGKSYDRLLPEGKSVETPLEDVCETGETVRDFRTQRRTKEGRQIEVSLTRSRITASTGKRIGAIEIVRDITSHREMERELIDTEKMAAVGKIASKVVHEIRNPLGTINLNVDILLDGLCRGDASADREAHEILQTIKRETRRLSQIAEEYLQFSRMPQPTGRQEDLNAVMVELADFLRPQLRRNGIRFVLKMDERRPMVACDSRLLRQIVLNLVRNAMDVVPPRSGQVMVVTTAHEDGGEIAVDDNGSGISEDAMQRIFEPFYTTKQDGTGLGLAVVRQIVEEHGGSVSCHSLPGKGTTFRVWLPARRGGAE